MKAAAQLPVWKRFHVRITLMFAVPVYVVLTLMAAVNYQRGVQAEMVALQGRQHSIVVSLAQAMDPSVASPEITAATLVRTRRLFAEIGAEETDVSSIYVLHETDQPGILQFTVDWVREGTAAVVGETYDARDVPMMARSFREGPLVEEEFYTDKWGATFSGYAPITAPDGTVVGIVGADTTVDRVIAMKRRVLASTLAVYAAAALMLVAVNALAGRATRAPVRRLLEMTGAVAEGRLGERARLDRTDELGLLGRHFDQMAAGLEEREHIRGVFGRYVSEHVARRVLANPEAARLGGDERVVTALFADIRGYSTISEQLTPPEVVDLLNRYMGAMCEVVDAHGGCVLDFFGDGLLVVFGAPDRLDDHAARGVACALAMHERLAALNAAWQQSGTAERWKQAGIDELVARIGLHTGRSVCGNMGSASRVKYMVLGEAVHVAQRVEALNKELGTRLLMTRAVRDRLPSELAERAWAKGAHPIDGRPEPVEVLAFG